MRQRRHGGPGAVGGSGVWLPTYLGDRLGARPGSTVTVSGVPVRLVGYYRNFYDGPLPAYWCSYGFMVQASETIALGGPLRWAGRRLGGPSHEGLMTVG